MLGTFYHLRFFSFFTLEVHLFFEGNNNNNTSAIIKTFRVSFHSHADGETASFRVDLVFVISTIMYAAFLSLSLPLYRFLFISVFLFFFLSKAHCFILVFLRRFTSRLLTKKSLHGRPITLPR